MSDEKRLYEIVGRIKDEWGGADSDLLTALQQARDLGREERDGGGMGHGLWAEMDDGRSRRAFNAGREEERKALREIVKAAPSFWIQGAGQGAARCDLLAALDARSSQDHAATCTSPTCKWVKT